MDECLLEWERERDYRMEVMEEAYLDDLEMGTGDPRLADEYADARY